jgi:ligand-binding sensor domain-containing protein
MRSIYFSVYGLIFIVLFAIPSFGQKIRFDVKNKAASVNCSMEDQSGNLWFGIGDQGIFLYNPSNEKESFINFTVKDGLPDNTVRSIIEDHEGNIWLGTNAGLCRYNSDSTIEKKTFTPIPIFINNSTYFQESKEKTEVKREIWSLYIDRSYRLWAGTGDGVFYCNLDVADESERIFTQFLQYDYIDNPNNLKLAAVTSILQDKQGFVWFSTWFEGLCVFDGTSVVNYTPENKLWFATMMEDNAGNLWFGSRDQGVYRYTPSANPQDERTFVNYFPKTTIFNACAVLAIKQDLSGNIWFGTEYSDLTQREDFGGLWCYHPSDSSFTNYTMKEGLPANSVFNLLADKSGKLWIGTRGMMLSHCNTNTLPKKEIVFTTIEN